MLWHSNGMTGGPRGVALAFECRDRRPKGCVGAGLDDSVVLGSVERLEDLVACFFRDARARVGDGHDQVWLLGFDFKPGATAGDARGFDPQLATFEYSGMKCKFHRARM